MSPHLLFFTPADSPLWVVGDMRRNGLDRSGRHSNCPRDVLVPLSQKDRLLKASRFCFFLVVSAAELGLTSMHRTDSMIMTMMSYSINSGLLTR